MRLSAARGLQRTTFSRIDKRKIRNHGFQPCKPECFLPASTANRPLGVAKSHAVKKKKKDGNQAVSAVTAAFPAKNIKRKGPKQQVVASDLCGWKPYVAAHSFQLQAMCRLKAYAAKPCTAESRMMKAASGHFIWNTLSVLRGRGTNAVLLPFISLSFSLLSWPSTRLSARGFQPQGAFSARLSAV